MIAPLSVPKIGARPRRLHFLAADDKTARDQAGEAVRAAALGGGAEVAGALAEVLGCDTEVFASATGVAVPAIEVLAADTSGAGAGTDVSDAATEVAAGGTSLLGGVTGVWKRCGSAGNREGEPRSRDGHEQTQERFRMNRFAPFAGGGLDPSPGAAALVKTTGCGRELRAMSEPDVSGLMSVAEAIAVIDREAVAPRVVELSLGDADGLLLAEDVRADRDYPPFDKSQMDGFAVRCGDLSEGSGFRVQGSGWELRVVGEIAAGKWPERELGSGEALAIMTGAPIPAGADGVVPVEETERSGERVTVLRGARVGRYIARRGSDVQEGTLVLEKGAKLGPARMAVAASVGKARVKVFAPPRVAVLGTGDELVGVNEIPGTGQIRNSNNVMLVSLLKRLGCEVDDLGVVRDEPAKIREAMEGGMEREVLFVTGGMSMGEYDYVPRILEEMGVRARITKLRIKPGKPFVFGVRERDGRFVFGLPGNPLSGFVCVVRLAARLIERLRGAPVQENWMDAKLEQDLTANGPREFYQPVVVEQGIVKVLGWKGSADLFSLAKANGLLVRGENEAAREAGEVVRVLEAPG